MADSSPRTHWKEWSELFPVDIVLAVVRCTPVQQLAINCIGGSDIASISIADKNVRSPIDAGLLIAAWQKYTHCNEWSETFPMVVGKAVCCSCSLRYPPRSASHKQQSAQFQEVLGLAICVASSISPSLAMANGSPRTHWKEWSELFPVDIVLAVVRCTARAAASNRLYWGVRNCVDLDCRQKRSIAD
jgi:hypothetical protein